MRRYVLALVGAFSRPINDLIVYCTPSCLVKEEELPGEDEDDIENDQDEGPPAEAPRFESELKLEEYEGMFDDYAEMILQYGYASLFVCAFPLCPLLARMTTRSETRADARKRSLATMASSPAPTPRVGRESARQAGGATATKGTTQAVVAASVPRVPVRALLSHAHAPWCHVHLRPT